jgi:predicted phage terminase large subunit-like protein
VRLPSVDDLARLPIEEQRRFLTLAKQLAEHEAAAKARGKFIDYVEYMWPPFISGRHHKVIADAFDRVIDGSLKRLIIALPPRHSKSEFGSWLLPSKFLGHYPDRKIIMASHSADLAQSFGRRVRNLVDSAPYQRVFPGTQLMADSKAAGRWSTSKGGEYFAIGVGGNVAGRGADLFMMDDLHSEQDYISALGGDLSTFDKTYEWYTSGPRQRLQPKAAMVLIGTRWSTRDVQGRLIRAMTEPGGKREQWEIIEFPAILNEKPLWPEFWPLEELLAIKETLPAAQWNAQYLQNPVMEEGALIKREWWKIWTDDKPPKFDYVIDCWDTAFRKTQISDYSARTSWGVFYRPNEKGEQRANIMLRDAERGRWEFPELKRKAAQRWKEVQPDSLIIEGKASGDPLAQELRAMGVPVTVVTPTRGSRADPNDKIHRVNAITDMFASGMVWCPETRWADEVKEECAAFPRGDHDDYVDTCLAPETGIITERGVVPISEIQEGDRVMTHKGRFRPVLGVGSRRSDHCYRLKAKGLEEIRITGEHPVRVMQVAAPQVSAKECRGVRWESVANLRPRPTYTYQRDGKTVTSQRRVKHDALVLPRQQAETVSTRIDLLDYAPEAEIRDDVLVLQWRQPSHCTWKNPREIVVGRFIDLDYEAGWCFGLFAAEGCVSRGYVHWSCDRLAIERVQRWVARDLGRDLTVTENGSVHCITVRSAPVAGLFKTFGYLAENKKVPGWVFSSGDACVAGFVAGFAHGDGYRRGHKVTATFTSTSLLWGIRLLLARLGIPAWIGTTKPGGRREVFGRICECLPAYRLDWSDRDSGHAVVTGEYIGTHIERVDREEGDFEVWNLRVEEDESYVTVGGTVHNCVMAMSRFRNGGFIRLDTDLEDQPRRKRSANYY